MDGANGQTGGQNSSSTFVLTAFISFGLFNIFRSTMPNMVKVHQCMFKKLFL
jgi:hypothetical protein